MAQIGWIDALRRWNAGMPSWCIPRKGTPGYDSVMRLRQGEVVKTPKQIIDELERKTTGKPKVEKKTIKISLKTDETPSVQKSMEKNVGKTQEKMMDSQKTNEVVAKGGVKEMDRIEKAFAKQMEDKMTQEVLEKKPELKEMLKGHVLFVLPHIGGQVQKYTLLKGKRKDDGTYELETLQVNAYNKSLEQIKQHRKYTGTIVDKTNELKLADDKGKELKRHAELYPGLIYSVLDEINLNAPVYQSDPTKKTKVIKAKKAD